MPKQQKNAVVKADAGNKAVTLSSTLLEQLDSLQGDGFENVTQADLGITILNILQSNSPEVSKKSDKFIEGAEEGMFINSLTKDVYETLDVIPLAYNKAYIEWIPRNAGGGFVGRFAPDHPRVAQCVMSGRKMITPDGNDMVETAEFILAVLPPEGEPFITVLPLKSTQLKKARQLLADSSSRTTVNGDGNTVRLPLFFQRYNLFTTVESNALGEWYGLGFEFKGAIDDSLVPMVLNARKALETSMSNASAAYAASAPEGHVNDAVAESMR